MTTIGLTACSGGDTPLDGITACDYLDHGVHHCTEWPRRSSALGGCDSGGVEGEACPQEGRAGTCTMLVGNFVYKRHYYGGPVTQQAVAVTCPGGVFMSRPAEPTPPAALFSGKQRCMGSLRMGETPAGETTPPARNVSLAVALTSTSLTIGDLSFGPVAGLACTGKDVVGTYTGGAGDLQSFSVSFPCTRRDGTSVTINGSGQLVPKSRALDIGPLIYDGPLPVDPAWPQVTAGTLSCQATTLMN